jgi:DNA-binding HxlR family transcriptional regulator
MKRACDGLCPRFQAAMAILSRPWSGLIIATLADEGPMRFSALQEAIPSIGDRMLSERLKELQRRGLVVREVDDGPPVRVSYSLTAAGRGFTQVEQAIARWGELLPDVDPAGAE